ncbi:glycosyltransferase [Prosthecobacter sp. SYSU 5D2]|uniref:glycosyltransferase n=1 Tax=Prosthecobacter sp. SYSU 5D2 TaxID=3134134 RepID=UPI0031FE7284
MRWLLLSFLASPQNGAGMLCRALEFSESPKLDAIIIRRLRHAGRFPEASDFWQPIVAALPRYRTLVVQKPHLTRSIILKAPGPSGEKGVLLMYFEYNWVRLALGIPEAEFKWLDDHYDLILSTSWSPTDYASLSLILARTSGPVFVQPCNYKERSKLAKFHPRIVPLESLPCDWIDPQFYSSETTGERPIDILMVANWGEFKRHWDFFNALRHLPPHWRLVLVGQKEGGRDADFILKLAREIGVLQQLEIHQSIPAEQVSQLQLQARVSLIFSLREGCCVAAVESLFAGCALGIRADAHVGPLHYIHEQTGKRLRPGRIAQDIYDLHQAAPSLKPAAWAMENISCLQTHAKLTQVLRQHSEQRGLPWTQDTVLPHWRPYPRHAKEQDAEALRPAYEECHRRFPQVFSADLLGTSHR